MMRHLSASVVAAVVGLLAFTAMVSGATPASAAHLNVVSSAIVTDSAQRCTAETLTTTAPMAGSSTTVDVEDVPPSCVGQQISVYVIGTNELVLATGSQAAATADTNSVAVDAYATGDVASVAIFFNTWWVDNDWTAPDSNPPAGTCAGYMLVTQEPFVEATCLLTQRSNTLKYLGEYNGGPGHYRNISFTTTYDPSGMNVPGEGWVHFQEVTKWRATFDLTTSAVSAGIDLTGDLYIYSVDMVALAPGETCANLNAVTFEERVPSTNPGGVFTISDAPISWQSSDLVCSR